MEYQSKLQAAQQQQQSVVFLKESFFLTGCSVGKEIQSVGCRLKAFNTLTLCKELKRKSLSMTGNDVDGLNCLFILKRRRFLIPIPGTQAWIMSC